MNLNKCILYGNLTHDPELKAMTTGQSIATFSLATNRRSKKDGQTVDVPEYHNIVAYGGQAESCARYLKKGSGALIEGRIQTRSYEKDGATICRTEIIAERVQFGPRQASLRAPTRDLAAEDDADQRPPSERAPESATASQGGDEWEPNPDDIPF